MNQNQIWRLTTSLFYIIFQLGYVAAELELQVEPEKKVTIQPPESNVQVQSYAILSCNIFPSNATVDSRWILPNGQIISEPQDRYRIAQGLTEAGVKSSILLIQSLSYEDAGFYTCEVVPRGFSKSLCACAEFPTSATTDLQLLVNLFAMEKEITVTEGNDTFVQLVCEMQNYIRPDEDLLWFKGDEPVHEGIGSRYSITIEDGTPNAAQSGGNTTVPSRQSILHIPGPQVKDSGEYVCVIRGTNQSEIISLTVNKPQDEEPTNGILTSSTVSPCSHSDNSLLETTPNNGSSNMMQMPTSVKSDTSPPTIQQDISCGLKTGHAVAMVFCTFIITAILSVFVTLIVVCLFLKPKQVGARQHSMKQKSISSPTHYSNGSAISAVNTKACEEEGIIPK